MSWPKLSAELTGPRSPHRCQSCRGPGRTGSSALERWREHDANDRPTQVVVVLCPDCAGRIVEKHPRLYSRLERNEPHPGTMGICLQCRHRKGVTCPLATFNGGPGVAVTATKPADVHLQRSPRRNSGWVKLWPAPATACTGREESTETAKEPQ